jgi:DNA-binding transcriptional LysR family regulator
VVRLGSVRAAAEELGMSDAGISMSRFRDLIASRAVDIALRPAGDAIVVRPFLKYQIITVAAPGSPLAAGVPSAALLREQQWMLGPSAGSVGGEIAAMLRGLAVPESAQRIFRSDAAALEEVRRVGGVTSRGPDCRPPANGAHRRCPRPRVSPRRPNWSASSPPRAAPRR